MTHSIFSDRNKLVGCTSLTCNQTFEHGPLQEQLRSSYFPMAQSHSFWRGQISSCWYSSCNLNLASQPSVRFLQGKRKFLVIISRDTLRHLTKFIVHVGHFRCFAKQWEQKLCPLQHWWIGADRYRAHALQVNIVRKFSLRSFSFLGAEVVDAIVACSRWVSKLQTTPSTKVQWWISVTKFASLWCVPQYPEEVVPSKDDSSKACNEN